MTVIISRYSYKLRIIIKQILNYWQNEEKQSSLLFVLSIGCEYNGECLEKNEKRFDKSSCTNYVCVFSKKQNRLVLKERIAGMTT